MYEYIFYYWYILGGHTKRGKSVIDAGSITALIQGIHLFFVISCIKFYGFDVLSYLPAQKSNAYLLQKWESVPYILIYFGIITLYCYKRLPKLQERFKDKTDNQILCWKNTLFVVCITLLPLLFIMWTAGAFD